MGIHGIKQSFNAGKLSPLLDARVEVEKYAAGCRVLDNFIPLTHGPLARRGGMEHMGAGATSDPALKSRLVGFNFSTTTNFIIEISAVGAFQFWSNGLLVATVPGLIGHPYRGTEIYELQVVQVNDVMRITHPDHPPATLSRFGDTDWRYAIIDWKWPALRDINITTTKLTCSHTTGENRTLTSDADVFTEDNVGGYYQITHSREKSFTEYVASGNQNFAGTSDEVRILGNWDLFSYGLWKATLHLEQKNPNNGEWEIVRSWKGKKDKNIVWSGVAESETTYRLRLVDGDADNSTANVRFLLEAADSRISGFVKITEFVSETEVRCDVKADLFADTETALWSEGAWSVRRGFPRAIESHDQRIIYGGCAAEPQKVWGSQIGDFDNFQRNTLATGSFSYQLAAQEANVIQWIVSQDVLIIGTSGDEWTMGSNQTDTGISALDVRARRRTGYGSDQIKGILAQDVAVFVQRNNLKVRQFIYNDASQSYTATDMTVLSEDITESGVVQLTHQGQRDSIVWLVTGDGDLIGMTLEKSQNVFAWHRHTTDGTIESVATIYGTGADEVWLSVVRDGKRYIERLNVDAMARNYSNQHTLVFLDAAVTTTGTDLAQVTGLAHLEGKTVSVLADGGKQSDKVVQGGVIPVDPVADTVVVGLPFTSKVMPMKVEVPLQDGTSRDRNIRIVSAHVGLLDTLGGGMRAEPSKDLQLLEFRDGDDVMDIAPSLFTGEKPLAMESNTRKFLEVSVETDDPFPFNLISLTLNVETTGN